MNDRELLAAAQFACQRAGVGPLHQHQRAHQRPIDAEQRFPMPFRDAVVRARSRDRPRPGLRLWPDPPGKPLHHGRPLGRGASGLMQVMPATARWTAKKIGLTNFTPDQINDRDTNIAIGTGYLKLVLDDFAGSMPLAAAAYNAGPRAPQLARARGTGPCWKAQSGPRTCQRETRDYVKKVLSNTTMYAAILSGQPQSLKARLGTIGLGPDDRARAQQGPAMTRVLVLGGSGFVAAMSVKSWPACNGMPPRPPGACTTPRGADAALVAVLQVDVHEAALTRLVAGMTRWSTWWPSLHGTRPRLTRPRAAAAGSWRGPALPLACAGWCM